MIINQRQRRLFQRRGRRRRNVLRRCIPMIRWLSPKRVMILMISIYVWTDNYASIYQYYCLLLLQSLSNFINHYTLTIDLNYRCRNNFFIVFLINLNSASIVGWALPFLLFILLFLWSSILFVFFWGLLYQTWFNISQSFDLYVPVLING